jgi:hypothetical protein
LGYIILYQLFEGHFSLNVTALFLAEMISSELEADSGLISADDIYFIRQYYHNKTTIKKEANISIIPSKKVEDIIPEVEKSVESDELVWTDIDALPQKNKFR